MSTPGESGPADGKGGDRRMSLGKYVKRMSSVFKREKSSRSESGTPVAPAVLEEAPQTHQPATEGATPAIDAAAPAV
ncbi:hypothetical protein DE146DRAFT_616046 [Phaeosphaeria sp. MPI-PUGE-AT-0046c]|nr:hypothetical protein DE146DRAFT_616046 [Phaeosphaeria sp. MPI-PUGE-AT-0046c]